MYKDNLLNFINENTDLEIEKDSDHSFIYLEAFFIKDEKHPKDKRKLMVRSSSIDRIPHDGLRTAKLKSVDVDKISNKCASYGLPITFNSVDNNGKESWNWDIGFKTEREKKDAMKKLSKNDINFLDIVIGKGGKDFAEYWDLNIEDNDKMKMIENKYKK